jgi:hypothetical protein
LDDKELDLGSLTSPQTVEAELGRIPSAAKAAVDDERRKDVVTPIMEGNEDMETAAHDGDAKEDAGPRKSRFS